MVEENSMVQTAVSQVQPLAVKSSLKADRFSVSIKEPVAM